MFYIYLYLIVCPFVSQASANEVSRIQAFNIFGLISNVVGGFSQFGNLISSINDVFGTVFSDDDLSTLTNTSTVPEDALLNISQLATKYGYKLEEHTVTTADGYKLTIHRIPSGKTGVKNNKTVFLMHGILDSSDSWIMQGPDKAMGYVLADHGFDVWMGNARGNKHALSHVKLNAKQSEFWKFTWEEIGIYDLPAMIDYSLNYTKQDSLYYVGHSQGTTSFYVMSSMKPEYNDKIRMMFSLAPVAWMRHVKSPIVRMFSPAYKVLGYLLSNFNTFSPTTDFFNKLSTVICSVIPKRCDIILHMIVGNDYKHFNESMLPVIFAHMPSGASTMQFMHYGQLVQSGRFCRYDFGDGNMMKYGQTAPPDYNLSLITVPMVFYYSGNDWVSDPSDVDILKNQVNVYGDCYVKDFSHLDFMYATNANNVIYSKIISQIYDYENKSMSEINKL